MKELIKQWIEYKTHKFDLTHCQHNFVEKERWTTTSVNLYTKAKQEFQIIHYFCSKCGEFKQVTSKGLDA